MPGSSVHWILQAGIPEWVGGVVWVALWVFTIEMKRLHAIPVAEETGQGPGRGQGLMEADRVLPVRAGGAGQCSVVAWADVRLYICLPAPEDGGPLPASAPEHGGLPQHPLHAWITASPRSAQLHLEGGVGRRKKPASPQGPPGSPAVRAGVRG